MTDEISSESDQKILNTVGARMYVCKPTDLTCLYQINVQARSLGKQFLTDVRKYVPNEKKRGGGGEGG